MPLTSPPNPNPNTEPPEVDVVARTAVAELSRRFSVGTWHLVREVDGHMVDLRLTPGAVARDLDGLNVGDMARRVDGVGPDGVVVEHGGGGRATRVVAPLPDAEGHVLGLLVGTSPNPLVEDPAELRTAVDVHAQLLGALLSSELVRDAVQQDREQARRAALVDHLTGLANREGWERAVADEEARAGRYHLPVTAVIVDLDRLKEVNDVDGHAAGDRLLRLAGHVLRRWRRDSDVVARLGGDEFGALLLHSGLTSGRAAVDRLRRELADAGVEASVGAADRTTHGSIAAAVEAADAAMYVEKRRRRAEPGIRVQASV